MSRWRRVLRGLCLTQFFNARLLFPIRFSWSYDRRIEAGLAEPHGRTAGPDSGRPSALIDLTSPQGESRDEMGWCDGLLMNLVPLLRLQKLRSWFRALSEVAWQLPHATAMGRIEPWRCARLTRPQGLPGGHPSTSGWLVSRRLLTECPAESPAAMPWVASIFDILGLLLEYKARPL